MSASVLCNRESWGAISVWQGKEVLTNYQGEKKSVNIVSLCLRSSRGLLNRSNHEKKKSAPQCRYVLSPRMQHSNTMELTFYDNPRTLSVENCDKLEFWNHWRILLTNSQKKKKKKWQQNHWRILLTNSQSPATAPAKSIWLFSFLLFLLKFEVETMLKKPSDGSFKVKSGPCLVHTVCTSLSPSPSCPPHPPPLSLPLLLLSPYPPSPSPWPSWSPSPSLPYPHPLRVMCVRASMCRTVLWYFVYVFFLWCAVHVPNQFFFSKFCFVLCMW